MPTITTTVTSACASGAVTTQTTTEATPDTGAPTNSASETVRFRFYFQKQNPSKDSETKQTHRTKQACSCLFHQLWTMHVAARKPLQQCHSAIFSTFTLSFLDTTHRFDFYRKLTLLAHVEHTKSRQQSKRRSAKAAFLCLLATSRPPSPRLLPFV